MKQLLLVLCITASSTIIFGQRKESAEQAPEKPVRLHLDCMIDEQSHLLCTVALRRYVTEKITRTLGNSMNAMAVWLQQPITPEQAATIDRQC